MKIVLASQSPRRQELLRKAGYDVLVKPAKFAEINGQQKNALEVVKFNAKGKCLEIVEEYGDSIPVLGADTVVVCDSVVIGKPKDSNDAKITLHNLSGRSHEVLTGIFIAYCGKTIYKVSKTQVFFKKVTDKQINDYVATGKPLDKAGSYGIQDDGEFLVDHIAGSYDNVVGLDVELVKQMLKELRVG